MKNLIKEPDHVAYSVRNIEMMVQFYHEVLGMPLEKEADYRAGKFPFMSVRAGSILIDLIPAKDLSGEEGRQRVNHICLRVEDGTDLEEVKKYLVENNVKITGTAKNNFGAFGNGPSIYIDDPEGNSVELKLYN